jgi:hypothetical protein
MGKSAAARMPAADMARAGEVAAAAVVRCSVVSNGAVTTIGIVVVIGVVVIAAVVRGKTNIADIAIIITRRAGAIVVTGITRAGLTDIGGATCQKNGQCENE